MLGGVGAGCVAPVLIVDDAVIMAGRKSRLVACVAREPIVGLVKDVERVRVAFLVEGREIGAERSDNDGLASIERHLPAGVAQYEARATVGDQELRAGGRVFAWDAERVILAVDIDQTIERTKYKHLLDDEGEDDSDPLKRSADVLSALAREYHILYLTGRPRYLLDKTRAWLREEGFPPGPVIMSESVRTVFRPGSFKEQKLRALRKSWPRLLIGIGDKPSDANAYGANEMLALAIDSERGRSFGRHTLVFRTWREVGQFFAANHAVLSDPRRLERVIDGKEPLSLKVPPYAGR